MGTSLAQYQSALRPTSFDLVNPTLPIEEWIEIGRSLAGLRDSSCWWIGDWLNFGEAVYGETYAQGMNVTGLQYKTVANYKWIAKHVPKDVRREFLSMGHHEVVASMDETDQEVWLEIAEAEDLTREELRERVRTNQREQPSWSRPNVEVMPAAVESSAALTAVKGALEEALELTGQPTEDVTAEQMQEKHERLERVLATVQNVERLTPSSESVESLKRVADAGLMVIRAAGQMGIPAELVELWATVQQLREALIGAGYINAEFKDAA